jgi:hypothetical protein
MLEEEWNKVRMSCPALDKKHVRCRATLQGCIYTNCVALFWFKHVKYIQTQDIVFGPRKNEKPNFGDLPTDFFDFDKE